MCVLSSYLPLQKLDVLSEGYELTAKPNKRGGDPRGAVIFKAKVKAASGRMGNKSKTFANAAPPSEGVLEVFAEVIVKVERVGTCRFALLF